jgi:hypothetical protein
MEKIEDLCHQYFDRVLSWYNGISDVGQYGVLFLLIIFGLFISSYFIISRMAK